MANIILTESELKLRMAQIYKEEKLEQIRDTWQTFSKNEKVFVLEFYKAIHPESKVLQESKWYNWLGDIVGFIPGLELVNVINGVSYWKQGEKLFALLSFLAGLPGLGLILGPVKLLLKGGGAVAKGFKGAVAVGDAGKLASLGTKSGVIGKLISTVGGWGVKLLSVLVRLGEKVPFLKTIISGIKTILKLFQTAKGEMGVKSVPEFKVTKTKPTLSTTGGGTPTGGGDPITNIMTSMFGSK
jgi:hypothetical protein